MTSDCLNDIDTYVGQGQVSEADKSLPKQKLSNFEMNDCHKRSRNESK